MTPAQTINALVRDSHNQMVKSGFWSNDNPNNNVGTKCALAAGELCGEFLEKWRKADFSPDEHCPEFTNQTIEIADTILRLFDIAGHLRMPLGEAIIAKMQFNSTRPHLHGKRF